MAVLQQNKIDLHVIQQAIDPIDFIKDLTKNKSIHDDTDPFFLVDLDDIRGKHAYWLKALPRVEPFYAVKCNEDPVLLKLLANLGTGFDCASRNEIKRILDLGVSPERIIYAHPCKEASYLRYAHMNGVDMMTFDNDNELYKIKEHHSKAKIVLRIITDDSNAMWKFSVKFGADMATSYKLIDLAVQLGLDLIGISFHVGSKQTSPDEFARAIQNCRELFDYAHTRHDLKMTLLDIGGGFPGSDFQELFNKMAHEINASLDQFFPLTENVRIIAEPGRYYTASAFTLCVNVIAKRRVEEETTSSFMYYINDGIYSSLNIMYYDNDYPLKPILVKDHKADEPTYKTIIWGPTACGMDCVFKKVTLPELSIGDYIAFRDMGAYGLSSSSTFNGMPQAKPIYMTLH